MERYDVVIVGGGIAGGALATRLARAGLGVLVLEKQIEYRDMVRGETFRSWGAAEAISLGVEQILLDAGGGWSSFAVTYDELIPPSQAEEQAFPLAEIVPGVPGSLNVGHPEACEALTSAAAAEGATVARGVASMSFEPGRLSYTDRDGVEHDVRCRLIVGADGRRSAVRKRAGFSLTERAPTHFGAGLLVEGLQDWPEDHDAIGTGDDALYLVFPRPGGRARLYLMWDIADQHRFTGDDREHAFLEAFRFDGCPAADELSKAKPAGPYAGYPMTDGFVDGVAGDGVVLVGDAAGWNDPVIGQGLSISMRDVRSVADVLLASDDWSTGAFAAYAEERAERMRRLVISARVFAELRGTFGPAAVRRRQAYIETLPTDPTALALMAGLAMGPESIPAESLEPAEIDRILSLGA